MGFFNFFKRDISEQEFQEQQKMKYGLEKTRTGFFQNIVNTLTHAQIDDDLYDTLEEQLILADVGPMCAVRLVDELRDAVAEKHLKTGQEALDELREIICRELTPRYPMDLGGKPAVILVIGVNGVGKTTTIAKLAHLYKDKGKRVMLAAGDTFRAAASEQLELWADRAGVPLVQAGQGADPAAVIFDAVKSATAKGYDMVIADTAGRGVLPCCRGYRHCADQAGRHSARRLRRFRVGKPRPAHPLHRCGREDRRSDGVQRPDLCRNAAARGSLAEKERRSG